MDELIILHKLSHCRVSKPGLAPDEVLADAGAFTHSQSLISVFGFLPSVYCRSKVNPPCSKTDTLNPLPQTFFTLSSTASSHSLVRNQSSATGGIGIGALTLVPPTVVPTIASINGHAYAGGFFVALACDYRVMNTGSIAWLTEVRLQCHGPGLPQLELMTNQFANSCADP